jgi:hypothetical protein
MIHKGTKGPLPAVAWRLRGLGAAGAERHERALCPLGPEPEADTSGIRAPGRGGPGSRALFPAANAPVRARLSRRRGAPSPPPTRIVVHCKQALQGGLVPLPPELAHSPSLTSMSQREAAAVPRAAAGGKCPRAGAASASVVGPGAPNRPGGPGSPPPIRRIAVHCEPPGAARGTSARAPPSLQANLRWPLRIIRTPNTAPVPLRVQGPSFVSMTARSAAPPPWCGAELRLLPVPQERRLGPHCSAASSWAF